MRHGLHAQRRDGDNNRRALLLVSRHVHSEAKPILLRNLRLDLNTIYNPSILQKFDDLPKVWAERLQYVRHVEMNISIGINFIFHSAYVTANFKTDDFLFLSGLHKIVVKTVFRLRTLFFNLHSISLSNGGGRDFQDAGQGPRPSCLKRVLEGLASKTRRGNLLRMFPHLTDIAVTNEYGTERFARLDTGGWERKYCKEKLPLLFRPDVRSMSMDHVCDEETGLSRKDLVRLSGPEPNEAEELNEREAMLKLNVRA